MYFDSKFIFKFEYYRSIGHINLFFLLTLKLKLNHRIRINESTKNMIIKNNKATKKSELILT